VRRTVKLRPRGLVTNPSEISAAPGGGMVEATDVVIRRDGILEPRPGFKVSRNAGTDQSYRFAVPLSDETLLYPYDTGANPFFRLEKESDGTQFSILNHTGDDSFDPPTPFRIGPRAVEARGSAYLTHQFATLKWDRDSTALYGAGLMPVKGYQFSIPGTGQAVDSDDRVAYRFCLVRTDPNGYQVRSPPSERVLIHNSTGSASDITLRFYRIVDYQGDSDISAAADLKDNDLIEIYRSVGTAGSTSTPSDELFLAVTHEVDTSSMTTESGTLLTSSVDYVDVVDRTPETSLGAALYTNASQQGSLAANFPPPRCHDLVLFKRKVFYFNLKLRPTVTITLEGNTSDLDQFTGNTTSGVNTITSVSGGDPEVGAYVQGGTKTIGVDSTTGTPAQSAVFPAGTTITAFSAGTATCSANALSTGTGTTFNQHGRITVAGTDIYYSPNAYNFVGTQSFTSLATDKEYNAERLVEAINSDVRNVTATLLESDGGGKRSVRIESVGEHTESFTVTASESGVFAPDPSVTGGVPSSTDSQPSGFAWSKTDLPEAVPLENYGLIAGRDETVLGAKAMRDSIMVWTENGVYRVTLFGDEVPRVDVLDPTLRLIAPNTLQVLENTCYGWTDRGVVAVAESGSVQELSEPFIAELLRSFEVNLQANPTTAGSPGSAVSPHSNEYLLVRS